MSVPTTTAPALRAVQIVLDRLAEAGIEATRDAGSFVPRPIGVLVGLPQLQSRLLASRTYFVPVHVVSSDPLNRPGCVDALYTLADRLAGLLEADTYVPEDWTGGVAADPLPSITLAPTVTVFEEG